MDYVQEIAKLHGLIVVSENKFSKVIDKNRELMDKYEAGNAEMLEVCMIVLSALLLVSILCILININVCFSQGRKRQTEAQEVLRNNLELEQSRNTELRHFIEASKVEFSQVRLENRDLLQKLKLEQEVSIELLQLISAFVIWYATNLNLF